MSVTLASPEQTESTIVRAKSLPNIPWQERPTTASDDVLWRHSKNPIIGRSAISFASCVYNSAVVPFHTGFVGVFRCDHKNLLPFLHVGWSRDGINWTIERNQISFLQPDGSRQKLGYGYDPRVTLVDDKFVLAWCNDFHGPTIGLACTRDFETFEQKENAFVPFNRNGVLFPKKIDGLYTMLHRPSDAGHTPFGDIFLSQSPDLTFWGRHRHVMSPGGSGWWDSKKVGAGAAPIETERGWLLFYHGVLGTCNGFNYSIGAALLDLEEPWRILARSDRYLLSPEADYEVTGRVPNVCFPCAALVDGATGRLALYYGAADSCTALAYGKVDEIVDFLMTHNCASEHLPQSSHPRVVS